MFCFDFSSGSHVARSLQPRNADIAEQHIFFPRDVTVLDLFAQANFVQHAARAAQIPQLINLDRNNRKTPPVAHDIAPDLFVD
jgi:hypothetical protein